MSHSAHPESFRSFQAAAVYIRTTITHHHSTEKGEEVVSDQECLEQLNAWSHAPGRRFRTSTVQRGRGVKKLSLMTDPGMFGVSLQGSSSSPQWYKVGIDRVCWVSAAVRGAGAGGCRHGAAALPLGLASEQGLC